MERRFSLDATATMSIENTSGTIVKRTALSHSVPIGSRIAIVWATMAGDAEDARAARARRPATSAMRAIHVTRRVSPTTRIGGPWCACGKVLAASRYVLERVLTNATLSASAEYKR